MNKDRRKDRKFLPSIQPLDARLVLSSMMIGVVASPLPPIGLDATSTGSDSDASQSGKGLVAGESRRALPSVTGRMADGLSPSSGGPIAGGIPILASSVKPAASNDGELMHTNGGASGYSSSGSPSSSGSLAQTTDSSSSTSTPLYTSDMSAHTVPSLANNIYLKSGGSPSSSKLPSGRGDFINAGQPIPSPTGAGTSSNDAPSGEITSNASGGFPPRPYGPFASLSDEINAYNNWASTIQGSIKDYNSSVGTYDTDVFQ